MESRKLIRVLIGDKASLEVKPKAIAVLVIVGFFSVRACVWRAAEGRQRSRTYLGWRSKVARACSLLILRFESTLLLPSILIKRSLFTSTQQKTFVFRFRLARLWRALISSIYIYICNIYLLYWRSAGAESEGTWGQLSPNQGVPGPQGEVPWGPQGPRVGSLGAQVRLWRAFRSSIYIYIYINLSCQRQMFRSGPLRIGYKRGCLFCWGAFGALRESAIWLPENVTFNEKYIIK